MHATPLRPLSAVTVAALLSACTGHATGGTSSPPVARTAGTGVLRGHLYGVGGPTRGPANPWPGTITITGPHVRREIRVGPDGAYAATLPAGRYTLVGRSPLDDDGHATCTPADDATDGVRVVADATTTADTYCQRV